MINPKLEQFAQREVWRNLRSMIMDMGQGAYLVFGRYRLTPKGSGYAVYNLSDDLVSIFSNKRTAMSWCVADNLNKLNLARNIMTLDHEKQWRQHDIDCSRSLGDASRHETHAELLTTKLQPKIQRYRSIANELEKCVNQAKYLQIKGFNNETARTSGHDANKTNS